MKSIFFHKKLAIVLLTLSLGFSQASAFSLTFASFEDSNPFVERFVSSLFQSSNKLGAALVGEVTGITSSLSTSTSIMTLFSKQKSYTIGISSETKVRKLGIPATVEDIKAGDRVSVVSSVNKNEIPKLRAKVVSILSQAHESKYKVATSTESVLVGVEATTTPAEATTTVTVELN